MLDCKKPSTRQDKMVAMVAMIAMAETMAMTAMKAMLAPPPTPPHPKRLGPQPLPPLGRGGHMLIK